MESLWRQNPQHKNTYLMCLIFPEYYGNDLEGFYDALTDITEETHVTIINRECMENTSYGSRLMWVFEDAASDNDNLSLAWTEVSYEEY